MATIAAANTDFGSRRTFAARAHQGRPFVTPCRIESLATRSYQIHRSQCGRRISDRSFTLVKSGSGVSP